MYSFVSLHLLIDRWEIFRGVCRTGTNTLHSELRGTRLSVKCFSHNTGWAAAYFYRFTTHYLCIIKMPFHLRIVSLSGI